jgi:hypothetical protein
VARTIRGWRSGRWLAAAGLLGVAFAPPAVRARRAFGDRITRLRNLAGDPVAPFLDAPCEREARDDEAVAERTEVAR